MIKLLKLIWCKIFGHFFIAKNTSVSEGDIIEFYCSRCNKKYSGTKKEFEKLFNS